MADTYTPLLRLTKPGLTTAGWGTLVNNGTFELIDNSIAGIVDVDVSAGNVTLTTASGASDQARYMCLRVINGPVSARNVIVPTLNKIYFVINEGAGPIQIKTATGAAVILLAGERTVVRVDAVSANVEIAIDRLQSLNLSFALAATSGGTGQSSFAVGDLLYASSTTAISKLTVGATNAVLTVAAGIPSWVTTLPAVSGGTGLSSPGTAGNVLSSNGTTWQSVAVSTLVPAATDTVSGVVELATNAEVQTGTDTTRAVTPASLRAGFNATGAAPVYACRAWVNFDGATGTIRASGNVTSVTKNGTGDYTLNFTTALPDANYSVIGTGESTTGGYNVIQKNAAAAPTTTAVRIASVTQSGGTPTAYDSPFICVSVFR
jgi:hypothetical protein